MGGLLLRLIVIAGVVAAVYFAATGEHITSLLGDNSFVQKIGDSQTITRVKETIRTIVPSVRTNEEMDMISGDITSEKGGSVGAVQEKIDMIKNPLKELWDKLKPDLIPDVEVATSSERTFETQAGPLPGYTAVCFPTVKRVCTVAECRTAKIGAIFTLVNRDERTLALCDSDGCEVYDVRYNVSGAYEQYRPEKSIGFLFTKENSLPGAAERTKYIAVALEGIQTTLYAGYCLEK